MKETAEKELPILDYEDGLERFVNKPELYHRFLEKFQNEPVFEDLRRAMESEDYKMAFQYAHTLKGNTANLSLVRLYRATIPFVEALRDEADVEEAKKLFVTVEKAFLESMEYLKSMP